MKKFTKILLMAALTVPFLISCSKDDNNGPTYSVLATILPYWNDAGFAVQMDDEKTMFPGKVRFNYKPKEDAQRAIIAFSELNTPVQGFTINADIFSIHEIETKDIETALSEEDELGTDGIEVVEAYIGGGYLNIEFKVKVDPYDTDQKHVVSLVDNQIGGKPEYDTHYPLELRFKRAHALNEGRAQTVSNIACFYIGNYSLGSLGCEGYELKFKGIDGDADKDPDGKLNGSYKVSQK